MYAAETFDGIVPMTNLRAVILGHLWSMKNIKAFRCVGSGGGSCTVGFAPGSG
jgi:hypothetical protein